MLKKKIKKEKIENLEEKYLKFSYFVCILYFIRHGILDELVFEFFISKILIVSLMKFVGLFKQKFAH